MSDDQFLNVCAANGFGAVARNEWAMVPASMLRNLLEAVEAAERERFAELMTDLRVLAKCCMWPDGDGAPVVAQMWAEEWVKRLTVHNVGAERRP